LVLLPPLPPLPPFPPRSPLPPLPPLPVPPKPLPPRPPLPPLASPSLWTTLPSPNTEMFATVPWSFDNATTLLLKESVQLLWLLFVLAFVEAVPAPVDIAPSSVARILV
jgi:hypothetical protein